MSKFKSCDCWSCSSIDPGHPLTEDEAQAVRQTRVRSFGAMTMGPLVIAVVVALGVVVLFLGVAVWTLWLIGTVLG